MRPRASGLVAAVLIGLMALRGTAHAFELTPAVDDPDGAGQTLTVDHEAVTLSFVGASSGWSDEMGWDTGGAKGAFRCRDVAPDFTTPLGRFDTRTELLLSLTIPDGGVWSTGPGERNVDGVAHARLSAIAPDTVLVEWEDLPGDGDRDFNDCVVALTITPAR